MPSAVDLPAGAVRQMWFFLTLSRIQRNAGWPETSLGDAAGTCGGGLGVHGSGDLLSEGELIVFNPVRKHGAVCLRIHPDGITISGIAFMPGRQPRSTEHESRPLSASGSSRRLHMCALTGVRLALVVRITSEERDNALAIAELRGDLVAVRPKTRRSVMPKRRSAIPKRRSVKPV